MRAVHDLLGTGRPPSLPGTPCHKCGRFSPVATQPNTRSTTEYPRIDNLLRNGWEECRKERTERHRKHSSTIGHTQNRAPKCHKQRQRDSFHVRQHPNPCHGFHGTIPSNIEKDRFRKISQTARPMEFIIDTAERLDRQQDTETGSSSRSTKS